MLRTPTMANGGCFYILHEKVTHYTCSIYGGAKWNGT